MIFLIIFLFFIIYIIFCYINNIENFDNKCEDCIDKCKKRGNSTSWCIDECKRVKALSSCGDNKMKKTLDEYKKYYYIGFNGYYLSYDNNKIVLSNTKKNYIIFKMNTNRRTQIQSKLNCLTDINIGCDYYFGIKDGNINLYKKEDLTKKNSLWNINNKNNKITLEVNKQYIKVQNNSLILTKKKNEATNFDISLFK